MNPIELLKLICLLLFNSAFIAGIFISSRYELKKVVTFSASPKPETVDEDSKMILWKLSFYSERWFGYFWSKPIINCMPCMAGLHSIYVFWYFYEFNLNNLTMYLFYVPILCFINLQLSKIC